MAFSPFIFAYPLSRDTPQHQAFNFFGVFIMSIKVAIASSDGKTVDVHFGKAKEFWVYELKGNSFTFLEKRSVQEATAESLSKDTENSSSPAELSFGECEPAFCGGGCSSGSGGCCGGGSTGPILPAVELLLDCKAILAAQIGGNIRRQFEKNAVSCFDIDLSVEEALKKLAAYYLK